MTLQLSVGQSYPKTLITSSNGIYHEYIVGRLDEGGAPVLEYEPKDTSNGFVKFYRMDQAQFVAGSHTSGYFVDIDADNVKFIEYTNTSVGVLVYLTNGYCNALRSASKEVDSHQINITLVRPVDTFSYVVIYHNLNATMPTGDVTISPWDSIARFWDASLPPSGTFDIKFLKSDPSYLQSLVIGQTYTDSQVGPRTSVGNEVVLVTGDPPTASGSPINVEKTSTGYYVYKKADSSYLVLAAATASTLLVLEEDFKVWLATHHSVVLTLPDSRHIFLALNPSSTLASGPSIAIVPTAESSPLDITNVKDYMYSFTGIDIRKYAAFPSWYDDTVRQAIDDVYQTILTELPLPGTTVSTTPAAPVENIIYAMSLYNSSLEYFNNTIAHVKKEKEEEQLLNSTLSSDDATLVQQINDFLANKTDEINQKAASLSSDYSELQALIVDNQAKINANQELVNLINTPEAVALSTKIKEMKNTVYDALKLLTENNRLGTNSDVVYVVNKVQL